MSGASNLIDFIVSGGQKLINSWHGSPHSWDKPDPMRVGTGEGGAAYGKGVLYSSNTRGVGEGYRDALSSSELSFNGKNAREFYDGQYQHPMEAIFIEGALKQARGNKKGALQMLLDKESNYANLGSPSNKKYHSTYGRAVDLLNDTPEDAFQYKQGGHLYNLGLDVNPNSLIDWQLPFGMQGNLAQDILRDGADMTLQAKKARADARGYGKEKTIDELTGSEIYKGVAEHYQDKVGAEIAKINQRMSELGKLMDLELSRGNVTSDSWRSASKEYDQLLNDREVLSKAFQDPYAAATNHFKDRGSSGITYMGEFHNPATGGKGARNYVSFNEDEIKVLNKYLHPATLGGGGILGSILSQEDDDAYR